MTANVGEFALPDSCGLPDTPPLSTFSRQKRTAAFRKSWMAGMSPKLSSNRMSLCNVFFGTEGRRLSGVVSSPRSALSRRMVMLRRETFLCVKHTHRQNRADGATASAEWSSPRPCGDASARPKTDAGGFGSAHGFSFALEGLTGFQHRMHMAASLRDGYGSTFETDPFTQSQTPGSQCAIGSGSELQSPPRGAGLANGHHRGARCARRNRPRQTGSDG